MNCCVGIANYWSGSYVKQINGACVSHVKSAVLPHIVLFKITACTTNLILLACFIKCISVSAHFPSGFRLGQLEIHYTCVNEI